ncbi:MAG: right-handed parallel beta-helix repeat-containing protein, partial [Bacteroidales bacterium]|nr:right-handed parallel beta-helix repeat-containing protein [Bacteroidales bacterium]
MKKHTFLFLTAALSLAVFSCAKTEALEDSSSISGGSSEQQQVEPSVPEEVPEGYIRVRLNAGTESAKTTISEGEGSARIVNWAAGDEIKVWYAGGSSETVAETAGKYSQMIFDVPEATETVYLVYPKAASSSLSESTLSVTIPAEQDGTFATANYSIARANVSGGSAQFYNASALLQIVLTDATLTKAVITGANGEALAGTVPFTFGESGVTPGVASSTSTQLTVNFSGAKTYYVATLPGLSLSNGFSVKFYRGDAPAGGWKTTAATTIARAKIASLGELDKAACFRYVTVSGAGTKSGRSWANAWGRDELKAFLVNTSSAYTAGDLALMDGVTFLMGAGTYVIPDSSGEYPTMNYSAVTTKQLTFHFVGGYPAAGGSTATPATNVTALSGGEKGAVLWITRNYHVSFDGFTITKSRTSGGGEGAMRHTAAGSLALRNCIFTDNVNTATCGALGISGGCTFTINSCTFDSNSGGNGGAFNPSSNGTVTNCTFSNNQTTATTGYGGAIKLEYGTVAFSECTFTGNHTALTGDGVNTCGGCMWITSGANASFEDCVFKGNQSSNVGGVLHSNGTAPTITFEDCTFGGPNSGDGNTANGGGVASLSAGYLTFTNCTFQGNSVGDWGGAIMTWASPSVGSLTINGTNGSYKSNSAEGGGFL